MNLHSVLFAPAAQAVDWLIAELNERGTAGIIEEGLEIRAFFDDDVDYSDLLRTYPVLEMRWESMEIAPSALPDDIDPILAGDKFFIVPASSSKPTPDGRYRLTINESTSFGSGRHESTQLMLAALEQTLKPGQFVLDIGAGTGILSMAAHFLGAGRVCSCDIYEDAVRSSRQHFGLPTFVGSVDAMKTHLADLTLANITSRVLDALSRDLQRVSAPHGRILISGFLQGGEPTRFEPEEVWERDGWLCWLCRSETVNPGPEETQMVIHSQSWW